MSQFVILELDDGYIIAGVPDGKTPETVAVESGAVLVDGGPYVSFEEAQDAMLSMPNPYERDEL